MVAFLFSLHSKPSQVMDIHKITTATEADPLIPGDSLSPQEQICPHQEGLLSLLRVFWPLGFICFGGAPAHIAILHDHLVVKHKWIDEELFLELFGLAQALPGNTSSQLAAATAMTRSGFLGGLIAISLFVFPGFLVLLLAGIFLRVLVDPTNPPIILLGIPPTAVALICKACYLLGAKLDRVGMTLAVFSTTVAVMINGDERIPKSSSQYVYPALLAVGGLVTLANSRLQVDAITENGNSKVGLKIAITIFVSHVFPPFVFLILLLPNVIRTVAISSS
jgi:chromate transport protein ChrA